MSLHGVLVIDKPTGPTSHDVVAVARRALGVRRLGHTGTLDPLASGVLPLVIGQATRLAQYLSAEEKEYEATVRFGIETDTCDAAGSVVRETKAVPSRDALESALVQFRGEFDQQPPIYSAKKIGGERAYARARAEAPVALAPVRVSTEALDLQAFDPPRARLRIVCSAGFYVRSLAHDLGVVLGTGAMLEALVRTRVGGFDLAAALPLAALATETREELVRQIVPLRDLLTDVPAATLTSSGVRRARQGQDLGPGDLVGPVALAEPRAATHRLVARLFGPDGEIVGLAEAAERSGFLHPALVFA